jgi:NADPH:quinone reductase-like Zn-dependent oxidoreductase
MPAPRSPGYDTHSELQFLAFCAIVAPAKRYDRIPFSLSDAPDFRFAGDPRAMKAIVFDHHGGPEVLRYTDMPEPFVRATDVLVRVRACALNHLDLWVRRGIPGMRIPLPHIPGSDIAGEIAAVGAATTRVKVGDKVILAPGISCGQCAQCLAGADNFCRQYKMIGEMVDGGCAEFISSPEVNAIPKPERLSFEEAAAVPLVFLTAWHMLIARAKIQPGETVLILGAGSGVGTAAIQIAKLVGARVIATAGSEEKLAHATKLGADVVIDHATKDIATEVKRLTNRRGVEVVFEHVGLATWEKSLASLAPGGRLVTCGATTGYDAKIDLRFLFSKQYSILGSKMGSKADLYAALEAINQGKLNPVIDKAMPLEKCAEAHARLESREQFGKIVLTVGA